MLSDILLVLVGGLIGIAGSLITTIVNNSFDVKKVQRQDLLVAYVEWARAIHYAIDETQRLWMFDSVERMKKETNSEELKSLTGSPSGKSREELVKGFLAAKDKLHAAEARVILVEKRENLRTLIKDISAIREPSHKDNTFYRVFNENSEYLENKRESINKILERVTD